MRHALPIALILLLPACQSCTAEPEPHPPRPDTDTDTDSDADADTDTDTDTDTWPEPEIDCTASDASMTLEPAHPYTGQTLTASVTATSGYVYVGYTISGGGASASGDLDISGDGPYTWSQAWGLTEPGWVQVDFSADHGATPICTGRVQARQGSDTTDTGDPPDPERPDNPIGIGLVSAGNSDQWDRAAELAGPGGHIKLIFAGMTTGMTGPEDGWVTAIREVYARDLVPVVRMGPPWGQEDVRNSSDDARHRDYTSLARSYANVVAGLPLREGWPIWIEVHNEPNLCYEWECDASEGWLDQATMAAEYASLLRDVTTALRGLGDDRVKVINGGLSPGSVGSCECGTDNYSGGHTSTTYIAAMRAEVPTVFSDLDGFASHAYPSQGEGWGFFEAYEDCAAGLAYWRTEIDAAGIPYKPVLITETGWTVDDGAHGSRDDVAAWTVSAWQDDWFPEAQLEAVMPFQLQDAAWDSFSWVQTSGETYPVFDAVRDWRCGMAFPEGC